MNNIETVREATKNTFKRAQELYGLDCSDVAIRFDLKGAAAGQAVMKNGKYSVRFNTTMINGTGYDHVLNDTVPHEVAHILCWMNPQLGKNHNAGWAQVTRALGGTGERCHSEDVVYAKGNTYEYTTTCGQTVRLSQRKHNSVQRGAVYRVRGGGRLDNTCSHQLVGRSGQPVHTQPEAAPTRPVNTPYTPRPQSKGKVTNAERVREQLRRGHSASTVVEYAITVLGMKPALAKTYVRNNMKKI